MAKIHSQKSDWDIKTQKNMQIVVLLLFSLKFY